MTKKIRVEIITIGDEILYGQILDTNAQWLSETLTQAGFHVIHRASIGDTAPVIKQALAEAQKRADIILTTGGLGPTKDDITKKTIADFFGVSMTLIPEVLEHIRKLLAARGRELNDLISQQAMMPTNGRVMHNRTGTAPGMWFEHEGKVYASMPGVPSEMRTIFSEEILPNLKKAFSPPLIIHSKVKTLGIPESNLSKIIEPWEDALPEHIRLAYLPSEDRVMLRLTATGDNREALEKELAEQVEKLKPYIADNIFAYGEENMEDVVARLLLGRGQHLVVAESCTGGLLSHILSRKAGASKYFKGGVIAYSNAVKVAALGVNPDEIERVGAVSAEVACEMAHGARVRLGADIALAVTGVAGPDGGSDAKPVGTVFIALSSSEGTFAKKFSFSINRHLNLVLSAQNALFMLVKHLQK